MRKVRRPDLLGQGNTQAVHYWVPARFTTIDNTHVRVRNTGTETSRERDGPSAAWGQLSLSTPKLSLESP